MQLIRFIAPHKLALLLVLLLLIGQAFAELSLPRYTSDIVDVGIQQSGVEHVATDELSARTYNLAGLLLDDQDRQTLADSYSKTSSGNYKLNNTGRENIDKLDSLLSVAMIAAHSDSDALNKALADAGVSVASGAATSQSSGSEIDDLIAAWDAGQLSADQRNTIAQTIDNQVDAQGGSLIEQQAISAAIAEYEELGFDMSEIQMDYLIRTGLTMLLFAVLCMVFAILVGFIASRTGARIAFELRNRLFSRVVSFSEGDVGYFSAASLITRGTNDIQQIQNTTIMFMRMVLYAPILAIGGIIMVMLTNASLGWIIVVAIVAVFVGIAVLFAIAMPKFRIMQKLIDRVNLVAREILSGLPVIRAYDRESFENERFDGASYKLMRTQLFTNRVMAFMMPLSTLIMNAVSVGIVWFGGFSIDEGVIQTGDLIAFITYAMVIIMGFMMIGMIAMVLPRAMVAAGRVGEVLDHEPSVQDPETTDSSDATISHDASRGAEIAFNNVSFRYDENSENVLSEISFTAYPGQTLAIVGATGSGKSTVIKLIERFYDVNEGNITVDGVDVRDISQGELRSQFGYVPQKAFLFSGTVASNVAYGCNNENEPDASDDESDKPDVSDSVNLAQESEISVESFALESADETIDPDMSARIQKALEIAQASEFVADRGGINAEISQGGVNVSGGQRQRLAIARALATDARAFLFDDAFSALDYKTDAALRDALSTQLGQATRIIVAQRISTIMNAENIVVLDEGRVVGQGTHSELLQNCEEYRLIAQSQLSEEELALGGDDA